MGKEISAFCTSCGAPMEAEDRHCPKCGRLQSGTIVVRSMPGLESPPVPEQARWRFNPRLLPAIGIGALLLVFLVGLLLGRLAGNGHGTQGRQLAAAATPTVRSTNAGTPPARSSSTSGPTASPSATQNGQVQFVWVPRPVTLTCSTANGCPLSGTFRNQGQGRGSGTARLAVGTEDGGTSYATCTVSIPATDPGATADVSCTANSPQLSDHLKSGGIVYIHGSAT